MRLADDEIEIKLATGAIRLRPTLRAAFRLERKYNGFANLFSAVLALSLSAISDVIKEGSGRSNALTDFFDSLDDDGGEPPKALGFQLEEMIGPAIEFLKAISGADDNEGKGSGKGEPIPFEEYHTRLFRIATGWLGWSPDRAWDSTPAEIIEAQKGRLELLNALFGSGKNDAKQPNTIDLSDPSARARLNALGNMNITSMAEVP